MRNSCFSYHHSRKPRRCNERARARTIGNTVLLAHAAPKKKRPSPGRPFCRGRRSGVTRRVSPPWARRRGGRSARRHPDAAPARSVDLAKNAAAHRSRHYYLAACCCCLVVVVCFVVLFCLFRGRVWFVV